MRRDACWQRWAVELRGFAMSVQVLSQNPEASQTQGAVNPMPCVVLSVLLVNAYASCKSLHRVGSLQVR